MEIADHQAADDHECGQSLDEGHFAVDETAGAFDGLPPVAGRLGLLLLRRGHRFVRDCCDDVADLAGSLRHRAIMSQSPIAGYGHFTSGGIDDRIEATLPPVFSPKTVPRS